MDILLSSRALGYLSIFCFLVVSFFLLIEFFVTATLLAVVSVVGVTALSVWGHRRRRHP